MIQTRKAEEDDLPSIFRVLEELGLEHPSLEPESFWVALVDDQVAGIANLQNCGESFYLSAVGTSMKFQGTGVGRELVGAILDRTKKDVYVYTKIPVFFEKLGFARSDPSGEIPPREIYDCSSCEGAKACVCMMRTYNAE